MKKNSLLIVSTTLCFSLAYASMATSESVKNEPGNSKITKSLAINRSMVSRFEMEYTVLKQKQIKSPSPAAEKSLEDLKYKIQALREDAVRLRTSLPENSQKSPPAPGAVETRISEGRWLAKQEETADNDLYQMHERALDFVSKNKFKEALKIYEELALKNPEDDQAYIIMGHLYLLSGQYDKSEVAFHNAVDIDPDNVYEIIPFYENMILQNSNDDSAYANLGYAYLILGDFLKAKAAFRDALSINPYNGPAASGLQLIAAKTN